ncbi:hypothetical protein C8J56DRAFT_815578 [Mycena floridula]|nr:hypothetical protein C8J56DRAFT_815578 [Mycena floridula]
MTPTMFEGENVFLTAGLDGQDDHIDPLLSLFESLQIVTVDAADPFEDIFSFSQRALFFAVISKKDPVQAAEEPNANDGFSLPSESPGPSQQPLKFKQWKALKSGKRRGRDSNNFFPDLQAAVFPKNSTSFTEPDAKLEDDDLLWSPRSPSPTNFIEQDFTVNPYPSDFTLDSYPSNFLPPQPKTEPLHVSWPPVSQDEKTRPPIGLIYLTMGSASGLNSQNGVGELNIGVILDPAFRGRGFGKQAVTLVLKHAFETIQTHRVQALILDNYAKDSTLTMFTQLNFGHEGTRRRSYFSPVEQEWKDVTCLGLLDTDWVMRSYLKRAPISLWDELLSRHQKEREELLKWDKRAVREQKRLIRSTSQETVRILTYTTDSEADSVRADSPAYSQHSDKGKRKLEEVETERSSKHDIFSSDDEDDFLSRPAWRRTSKLRRMSDGFMGAGGLSRSLSPAESQYSTASSVPDSDHSWDVVESSSDAKDLSYSEDSASEWE